MPGIRCREQPDFQMEELDHGAEVFKNGTPTQSVESAEIEKLHAKIGRLTIENDFLEKVLGKSR